MKLVIALLSIALAAPAAEVEDPPRPKLPPEVQAIMGLAYASPPEIAADAFLRLAASGKIADREAKRQLIDQAFDMAGSARDRFRRRHITGSPADSRSGSIDRAARLALDTLSLRVRAVRAMLDLDPAKARELFSRMETPQPEARSCEDALIFDVTGFYALLSDLANQTFSTGERRLEQHVGFVRPYVVSISSPVEVAPAARLVRTLSATPRQRDLLLASFVAALQNVAADGRSFLETADGVTEEIEQLAQACGNDGLATDGLKSAFEKYMERQRGSAQCSQGSVKLHDYWTTPGAQALLARGLKLRWGPEGVPGRMLTLEERRAAEWQTQLAEALNEMESWKPAPAESEADYFHQRCLFYEALIELTPPGARRDNLVAGFLGFLSSSPIERESPAEWLARGAEILSRLRQSGDSGAERLLDAFAGSANPALALTARLERLAPQSPLAPPR
ncbi:MAG: hypothetical protein Q8N47_27570 [Bryobacterales bacterium]|nr:hypothetical protein [Bryobacterales bacterium]